MLYDHHENDIFDDVVTNLQVLWWKEYRRSGDGPKY